MSHFER